MNEEELEVEEEFEEITVEQMQEEEEESNELFLLFGAVAVLFRNDVFDIIKNVAELDFVTLGQNNRKDNIIKAVVKRVQALEKDEIKRVDEFLFKQFMERQKKTASVLKVKAKSISKAEALKGLRQPWGDENNPLMKPMSFMDRIHENKKKLVTRLIKSIESNAIEEKSTNEILKNLESIFESGAKASHSLLISEATRVTEMADSLVFKSAGIKKVKYNSKLEKGSTCTECRNLHGEEFDLNEKPTLPRHTNCKCFYTPMLEPTTT